MASLIGKAVIVGLGDCTVSISSNTYREVTGATIAHAAEAVPIHDGDKKVVGYVWNDDEGVELDLEVVPMAGSLANAKTGAGMPVPLTEVTLTATTWPAITIGGFTDVLNSTNYKWFYLGGATWQATGDSTVPWTLRMKITTRKLITSLTAIS